MERPKLNTQKCCKCKENRLVTDFYPSVPYTCKDCLNKASNKCKKDNPEKFKIIQKRDYQTNKEVKKKHNRISGDKWKKKNKNKTRDYRMKYFYGISEIEYNLILTSQGERCAICRILPEGYRLQVDHCHSTGKVRGLLCRHCNWALGFLKDSLVIIKAATDYLEKHN